MADTLILNPGPALRYDAGGGASFFNGGPDSAYYSTSNSVSSTLHDGTLGVGELVTLEGVEFFIVASGDAATLTVIPPGEAVDLQVTLTQQGASGTILMQPASIAVAGQPGATVTVGSSSGQLVAANATRRYLSVNNPDGPGDVWLRFDDGTAVVGAGQPVPAGFAWTMPAGAPIGSAVQAVSTVAGTDVGVVEW